LFENVSAAFVADLEQMIPMGTGRGQNGEAWVTMKISGSQ